MTKETQTIQRADRDDEVATALSAAREASAFGASLLADCLERLADAVERHGVEAEAPDGFLEEVVTHEPRLHPATQDLSRDHREFPAHLRELADRAHRLVTDAEVAFDRLAKHQMLAIDLIEEAFFTDIGGQS